jgi:hypothetical protein
VTAVALSTSRDVGGRAAAAAATAGRRGIGAVLGGEGGRVPQPARNHNCYALLLRAAAGQALPAEAGATVVRVFRHLHAYDLLARCVCMFVCMCAYIECRFTIVSLSSFLAPSNTRKHS